MPYFNFQHVAQEAGIAPNELERMCRLLRQEFQLDDMMYELHVLRACMAVRDGYATVEAILRPPQATPKP